MVCGRLTPTTLSQLYEALFMMSALGQTRTFVQSVEALRFDLLPIGKYMPVKIASPTNSTRTIISIELSPL
jgi:hypothetical protein